MIELLELTKRYGEHLAVDHVSFTARPGRVTGFLGPNGAGKSTSLRILAGLTPATTGTATVLGRRYADLPDPGREPRQPTLPAQKPSIIASLAH